LYVDESNKRANKILLMPAANIGTTFEDDMTTLVYQETSCMICYRVNVVASFFYKFLKNDNYGPIFVLHRGVMKGK